MPGKVQEYFFYKIAGNLVLTYENCSDLCETAINRKGFISGHYSFACGIRTFQYEMKGIEQKKNVCKTVPST